MKVSLNLAQYYSNVDLKNIPKDELLARMGAQLGAIEDFTDYAPRYKHVVVVRVVSCEKHPNADKLHVCRVDDGGVVDGVERDEDGLVQVVCGAPNVHADMFAAWIPPGATVPSTYDSDPFVLEARELRGSVSNGMLASPHELGISDNHDGILEIDPVEVGREPVAGESVADYYGLDDFVIDCENKMFTHRPDCFGTLGIAREIAGIFGYAFSSPDWYVQKLTHDVVENISLSINNNIPELVPRFMMQAVSNLQVGVTPTWLQAYLKRVGMNSVNNVVDYSNYYMMLTAQPTHAFDYDKVVALCGENPVFAPRLAMQGEKLALLNGKTIELTEQDIVITANDRPIALAGVMGGSETEVEENTKNIVIECATFDMYAVRKVSMRHGLFTDAVTRYTKGQSPLQNDRVLAKLVDELMQSAGGKVASELFDSAYIDADPAINKDGKSFRFSEKISLPMQGPESIGMNFINDRLGSQLSQEDVIRYLTNVEFEAYEKDSENLFYWAPFWRMDIEIAEDIVEEIGRLYGYEKLPIVLPERTSKPVSRNERVDFAEKLRKQLSSVGANEVLTYSFVHNDLLKHAGINAENTSYHLRNALSPDLQYYRPSLLPSLLAKVRGNIKSQAGSDDNEFALFEIGSSHTKDEFENEEPSLPKQNRRLSFVFAAEGKAAKARHGAAYYHARKYLDYLCDGQVRYIPLDTNDYVIAAPFEQGRSAIVMVNDQMLGVIGELRRSVRKALKLPDICAAFEIDVDLLREHIQPKKYKALSVFPSTQQDITFEVNSDTTWYQIEQLLHAELAVAKAEQGYDYILQPLDIFHPEDSGIKRMSFRIEFTHHEKTLKTEEINSLLDQVSSALKASVNAARI